MDGNRQGPGFDLQRWVGEGPSMLAYWDRELHCRFATVAYASWFGVDPNQLLGTSLGELLGPERYAVNQACIEGALRGEVHSVEQALPGPEGALRHGLSSYQPDIVGGAVAGFSVTLTDLSRLRHTELQLRTLGEALAAEVAERRAAEDNLAETQQCLELTLTSVDAGFMATDRQGRVSRMNAVAERLTGRLQPQTLGVPLWAVLVLEDRPEPSSDINPVDWFASLEPDAWTSRDAVVVSFDGLRSPVRVTLAPTHAAGGALRGLAVVIHDMTQKFRAEIESSLLAAIVESSQDAIIGKTLDGRLTSWNAAAEALFGYRAEEAIGRQVQMLIPADRQHEEMRILADLTRGVRVSPFDTLRRTRDGRLIEVSITISPIRDARGTIVGASKIARDITHRKQAEHARLRAERLEAENRQIQEANRVKSLFLANMSHELRTPLNGIIGFADLLLSGAVPPESPKRERFLGHIAACGRHLLQLINDVLDLSKVESGKFEFFPEPVDLAVLIREVGDILHTGLLRKNLQLDVDVGPGLTGIVIDPSRLKQVLYNYLSNAIKFTPERGRITVRARAEGADHFRLEVEDTGIGIPAVQLPRLFVEFQQLDAGHTKQHQGTGLGLALTRRLVEAQGGAVGVRSEPGRGSVFHVLLRRVNAAVATGGDAAAGRNGPRLLVANPAGALQARLVAALTRAGFEVEAATTEDEASTLALRTAFDGLTLGLQLPDLSGLAMLAGIRDRGPSRLAPVIGLTIPVDTGAGASFAIADILFKPIRSDEVVAAMARLRGARGAFTRVMVIDDDPVALDLMRATLAGLGIEAACLQDGRQALRELDLHRPQAIVLDLMMPAFDGFAVLDALHRNPVWRETPVFIWTSMMLSEEECASLTRSARAILSKGGGNFAAMLERLRQWRPPPMAPEGA